MEDLLIRSFFCFNFPVNALTWTKFYYMKQYTLFALDYTDEGALERRMQAREEHLQGARSLKEQGNLIFAGAILDESGKMVGSNLILQFAGDEELEEWKGQEPYILKKVWEKVDIRPFKVAQL